MNYAQLMFESILPTSILAIAVIAVLITSVAMAFRAGHNIWGISNLLLFTGIFYFLSKGHTKLALAWIVSFSLLIGHGVFLFFRVGSAIFQQPFPP